MSREDSLRQLQRYNFAAYDMLLFLDTHPDDKKAFELFRSLVERRKTAKEEFEKEYGPLSAWDAAEYDCFKWIDSPFPWEKEAN